MVDSSLLFSLTSVFIVYVLYQYFRKDASRASMPRPPGPAPKPLVGNTFDVPLKNHHLEYAKWGRLYQSAFRIFLSVDAVADVSLGDFVYATTIAGDILVLNKREDADELLEKRAKKYSGRPRFPVLPLYVADATARSILARRLMMLTFLPQNWPRAQYCYATIRGGVEAAPAHIPSISAASCSFVTL